jgi:hypothetical protein
MESGSASTEHTTDELWSMLNDLRMAIKTLETALTLQPRPGAKAQKLLREAKIQEAVILAKLVQAGVVVKEQDDA